MSKPTEKQVHTLVLALAGRYPVEREAPIRVENVCSLANRVSTGILRAEPLKPSICPRIGANVLFSVKVEAHEVTMISEQ